MSVIGKDKIAALRGKRETKQRQSDSNQSLHPKQEKKSG